MARIEWQRLVGVAKFRVGHELAEKITWPMEGPCGSGPFLRGNGGYGWVLVIESGHDLMPARARFESRHRSVKWQYGLWVLHKEPLEEWVAVWRFVKIAKRKGGSNLQEADPQVTLAALAQLRCVPRDPVVLGVPSNKARDATLAIRSANLSRYDAEVVETYPSVESLIVKVA